MDVKRRFSPAHAKALLWLSRKHKKEAGGQSAPEPVEPEQVEETVGRPRRKAEVRQFGDTDPPNIVGEGGKVRLSAVLSDGFTFEGRRADITVPWPSFILWEKILRLKDARDAVLLKIQYNAGLLATAIGEEVADPRAMGTLAIHKWQSSGVEFNVNHHRTLDQSIAYTFLWPLHIMYLEERIEQAFFKWQLKRRLARVKKWESKIFKRSVNTEEGAWIYMLLEKDELGTFVEAVIPAIADFYAEAESKKKPIRLP